MPQSPRASKLGIIAGAGALPGILASACARDGRPHYILGLAGFADATLLPRAADEWIRLGEIGRGIDALKNAGVDEVVMAGAVRRPAFSELKPDWKGITFLARIAGRALGDDNLLRAVIEAIEEEGFRVIGVDDVLADLLAPEGAFGRVAPDSLVLADIMLGFVEAKRLGAADLGQSAVVRAGAIIGVEDENGTDALMRRCADPPGSILVKVKKPHQERRADLPVIGPDTVSSAKAAGFLGIAVEAGHTLVIDRVGAVAAADAAGIFVYGVKAS